MSLEWIGCQDGIHVFDACFVRPRLAAVHLIVEGDRAAFVDCANNAGLPLALEALKRAGLGPESVDYIFLTHIHLDHAGGAGAMMAAFPHARLVVHPRGARHMIDPAKLMAATEAVYGRETAQHLYGALLPVAAERVVETTDGMVLRLGRRELAVYASPGHAKHHNFIHDRSANTIFSGDTFGIAYPECEVSGRPLLFPSTTPSQFDPVDLRDSVERMIALEPEAIYPTHFGRLAPPRKLAEEMLRRLDDFVGIALRAKRAGGDPLPTILSDLTAYVVREAHAHGVTLPEESILDLWRMDIDLNAQGLAVWVSAA